MGGSREFAHFNLTMRLTFFTPIPHFLIILRGATYGIPLSSQIIANTMKLLKKLNFPIAILKFYPAIKGFLENEAAMSKCTMEL